MSKPFENKTEEMKQAIEVAFPGTANLIANKKCPCCKSDIGPFRDALSKKEYSISGMCQSCQDAVFGV
jgi:hypothetical protein